jgi:hypothetical protein
MLYKILYERDLPQFFITTRMSHTIIHTVSYTTYVMLYWKTGISAVIHKICFNC